MNAPSDNVYLDALLEAIEEGGAAGDRRATFKVEDGALSLTIPAIPRPTLEPVAVLE